MRRIFSIVLLGFCGLAVAASDLFGLDQDDNGYNEDLELPWIEIETRVKVLPNEDELQRVPLDTLPAELTLYVDKSSIVLDERDWVIRAWFVARSRQGVSNGSYEGIRCATGEYKVYAYANPQRKQPLRVASNPRWRAVRGRNYRKEMMRDYLCNETRPRSARDIDHLLR